MGALGVDLSDPQVRAEWEEACATHTPGINDDDDDLDEEVDEAAGVDEDDDLDEEVDV